MLNKIQIRCVNVGVGDCIGLQLENENDSFRVMVDCGSYNESVRKMVMNDWGGHINLLIATHVDSDHIVGLTSMLEQEKTLQIDQILFNSYQRMCDTSKHLSDEQKQILMNLSSRCKPVLDVINSKISTSQALTLSETILSNPQWASAWKRQYVTDKLDCLLLKNGKFGSIHFLSPTLNVLRKLDREFKELFYRFFFEEKITETKEDEIVYEMLLRIADEYVTTELNEENINAREINEVYVKECANRKIGDISLSNKASIAFVWECGEHRVLFMGDASPKQVNSALRKLYPNDKTICFDAIKVSHHGSAHNTSNSLMKTIDSRVFLFTGGEDGVRPSDDAIARIVNRPINANVEKRTLYFNAPTTQIEKFCDEHLQEKLHYTIQIDNDCVNYEVL